MERGNYTWRKGREVEVKFEKKSELLLGKFEVLKL